MRNEGITGGEIVINNTKKTVNEMKLNGAIIWPTSYRAVLIPTWGSCGGNYTTSTVPASGGYANVSWEVRIYRGSQTSPVYTRSASPDVVYISDSDNFSYANDKLTANNRGKNGISGSSGSTYPQNAAARTCYIYYASRAVTYDGKQITAVFYSENTFGMTQVANNFQWGAGGYRNVQVTLGAYTSQNNPAPAGESTTTVSAQCQFYQNAVFTSGESYEYQEQITAQNRFTFSSTSDWITFPSGGTVKIATRGQTPGELRPGSVTATVTGTSDNGSAQLWQAANVKTKKSDETITITKIALDSVTGPISVLGQTINFTAKVVTGQKKAEVYSYSSGAPDSGGEITDLANTAITPDSIGWSKNDSSYTYPTGSSYTVAHNKHSLSTVSWKFKAVYRGCTNCDPISLTQSADKKNTETGDSGYAVTFSVGTNTIGPAGGAAAITCEAYHYHGTTVSWDSDGEVIAAESSNVKVSDTFTITKIAGSDTYFSINSANTQVSHTRNMYDAEATDTVTYRLKNDAKNTVYADQTFTAVNAKDGDPTYTEWADSGGHINEQSSSSNSDYKITTFSVNKYSSSASPAPWGGGSSQLSWSADHLVTTTTTWKQLQIRTKSQLYLSGYTKQEQEQQTVDRQSQSSSRVSDTPTFSSDKNWCTINAAGAVTISENSSTARNATITATNGTATKTVKQYQAKKVAISVDKNSISFNAAAGSATFTVTWVNTVFTIAHAAASGYTNPISSLSPSSGAGSGSGSGTKTYTVNVGANSSTSNARRGIITITPGEAGLSAIQVTVEQAAAEVQGSVTGYVNASWNGSTQIDYEWQLSNSGSAQKTIQGVTLYLYSVPEGEGDPDESDKSTLVTSRNLGNVTVGGYDDTSWESGSFTGLTRNLNRTYWVKLMATGLESDWNQVEESV